MDAATPKPDGPLLGRLGRRRLPPAIWAKRRVRMALGVLCVLLVAMLATGVVTASRLYSSAENRYIRVVFPLMTLTRDIVLQMAREDRGTRGYIITADRRSLAPYFAARTAVTRDIEEITKLTSRRPALAARLHEIEREVTVLHGFYDRLIVFVADGTLGRRRAQQEVLGSERLITRFQATTALMQHDIDRFVQETRRDERVTRDRAYGALALVGFLALAIAVTLFAKVPERLRRLYSAEEEARLQAEQGANAARALEHVSDAVLLVDEAGLIRSWNTAAEQLFAVPAGRALLRRADRVVPSYESLIAAAGEGTLLPVTIDDDEHWLASSASEFEGGSVLTVRDATAAYRLERARSDFVATASHELRTPLTSIYGGIRTLNARRGQLAPDQEKRLLSVIEQEAGQLTTIVDQLLTASAVDRGELHLAASECDLITLCTDAVDAASARAPDAPIMLQLPLTLPPVRCDEAMLRQVLANLIDNAIKYSSGPVVVKLSDDDGRARIDVTDDGPGIPPSEQDRIFDKFYRLDAPMSSGVGGSGLGLYISRAIVDQMGGSLSVRSSLDSGSTFTVTLPAGA
jgi:two-component system phosphate regulon sensor histidine kinase PhoR